MWFQKSKMPTVDDALTGHSDPIPVSGVHFVNGNTITPPFPDGIELAYFGMGCFWGAERLFWQASGVYSTAVGYGGGITPNATYEEVCSGQTGHTELVLVAYDPQQVSYEALLQIFWEGHDPTQGMSQGNDVGTQYRSAIYAANEAQLEAAKAARDMYQRQLSAAGYGEITSELEPAPRFFYAEEYHQQYLAKNPNGYCGIGGTGVSCPIGLAT